MPANQNGALRIFLSSTAEDLREHRKAVSEAIIRLGCLPVAMETFGSQPHPPLDVCLEELKKCDAVVLFVAHRYGWAPSPDVGGDGKKSVTWLEVETAFKNNIPVFPNIVDPLFLWTQAKEQDRLINAKDDNETLEISKSVKSLAEFKKFIDNNAGLTRETFTTPDDLAKKVTSSLAKWLKHNSSSPPILEPKKVPFQFRIVHPLQPAPHFKGRVALLAELKKWWQADITPDRVRSLVAIGGTGKTAVAERFLDSIKNEPLKGSILVWSFYEDNNTDAFLREACTLFTGKEPEGEGGKLETLQRALATDNKQHLLVLDGLERVQSEGKGTSQYARGDLENHQLKNLLRAIAAGTLGNTRALITTRFKLTDLAQWENAGYKSHSLEVLDKDSAIEVLKAWQIKGDDTTLDKIALSVGRHALSVSVLGSYLNQFCDCDPLGALAFRLDDIVAEDQQAARLARILNGYAQNLHERERDFLVRLSVFPKGVTVEIFGYLIGAGGDIAGTLIDADQHQLALLAEKLVRQGLIYSYKHENTLTYTAHPFLREYFRTLLGINPENIHEVVAENLSIGLDTKPENKPTEATVLDKYEQLIEYSIMAGHYQEAFDIFNDVMGGSGGAVHIFHTLGDYGRIIRVCSLFTAEGTPQTFTNKLSDDYKAFLINRWGLAAMAQGDLKTAEACFQISYDIDKKTENWRNYAAQLNNLAQSNINKGTFTEAKKLLEESLFYITKEDPKDGFVKHLKKYDSAYLAYTQHKMGEIEQARKYFEAATEIEGKPLFTIDGFYECEHLFALGEKEKCIDRANENLTHCERHFSAFYANLQRYILGLLNVTDNTQEAREHLQKIRTWTEKSGDMDCILHSYILAAEIGFCEGDYEGALLEATAGYNQAESCGFGKYAIDLLLLLAKIQIAMQEYTNALGNARQALDRSAHPDCQNAWGQANGGHLCGVCHIALGETALARQRLEVALALRIKILHPEAEETRRLLEGLG